MATAKTTQTQTTSRPMIQIDDVVREMTEEEFTEYQSQLMNPPELQGASE